MVNFTPPQWGDENASIDYTPYIEGTTQIDAPIDITGHTLTGFGEETIEALKRTYIEKRNGINRVRVKTVRPAQVTERTFTIGMGSGGPIWTPVMQRARRGDANCRTTIFVRRNCPSEPQYEHAYIWPECIIGPLTRPNDFIVNDGNGEFVSQQSEVSASDELLLYALGGFKKSNQADQLYDVTFLTEDCAGCSNVFYSDLIAVGGDGTNDLLAVRTSDRFATVTELDTGEAAAGSLGQAVLSDGDTVLIAYTDDVLATAAAGGILVSSANGDGLVAATITTPGPIWDLVRFAGVYLSVGGATGAQAKMFESTDGTTWTAVSSAAFPATKALLAAAADNEAGRLYVAGEAGLLLKGTISGENISFAALTPPSVGTNDILDVAVLERDHIVVVGEAGYYAESLDGGVTWSRPPVPAGSTAITSVAGDRYRTIIGYGTAIAVRDILNDNDFVVKTLEDGATLTGNVAAIAKPVSTSEGFNYFALVTSHTAGENVVLQPFHPQA